MVLTPPDKRFNLKKGKKEGCLHGVLTMFTPLLIAEIPMTHIQSTHALNYYHKPQLSTPFRHSQEKCICHPLHGGQAASANPSPAPGWAHWLGSHLL